MQKHVLTVASFGGARWHIRLEVKFVSMSVGMLQRSNSRSALAARFSMHTSLTTHVFTEQVLSMEQTRFLYTWWTRPKFKKRRSKTHSFVVVPNSCTNTYFEGVCVCVCAYGGAHVIVHHCYGNAPLCEKHDEFAYMCVCFSVCEAWIVCPCMHMYELCRKATTMAPSSSLAFPLYRSRPLAHWSAV